MSSGALMMVVATALALGALLFVMASMIRSVANAQMLPDTPLKIG